MADATLRLCPKCGNRLQLKRARASQEPFLGCVSYPTCRYTENYDSAMAVLQERLVKSEQVVKELARSLVEASNGSPESELVDEVAADALAAVDRKLRAVIFELHPDRRGETVPTTEVVAQLNRLRAEVAA